MKEIRIKYLNDFAKPVGQIDEDSWCDLRAAEAVEFSAGEFKLIHLGVCIELPDGYEALLAPRSSTFKNYGLIQTNGVGVVDNDYNGDNDWWKMPCYATRDVVVNAGDRIAQFRIQKTQGHLEFKEVKELNNEDRHGFGHTGVK